MHKAKRVTHVQVCADLWATSLLPEGVIERWLASERAFVKRGEPLAMVRIEGALHELTAPADGWLAIERRANAVVEPGAVIARIEEA